MRHLNSSVNGSNLIDSLDLRAETTMNAENLAINNSTNGQVVEDFSTVLPGIGVTIFPVDFVIESIHCGDLSA